MANKNTKQPLDLFRPIRKGDQLRGVYLHADGHAVAAFERRLKDVDQTVTYYQQIDSLGVACCFQGRIVFSQYSGTAWLRAMLAAGCHTIRARAPGVDHGSEATKARGISVGYVTAETRHGEVSDYDFPGLFSGAHTYQPDVVEAFDPGLETYSGKSVAQTLRLASRAKV